jgi:hypothetical protein
MKAADAESTALEYVKASGRQERLHFRNRNEPVAVKARPVSSLLLC